MIVPTIDRRSGQHRIAYSQTTRLSCAAECPATCCADGGAAPCSAVEPARVANLSEGGLFVSSGTLCPVGTELHCALPLGPTLRNEEIDLHGKVVWTASGNSTGMGIQFLELDDHQRLLLRQAISAEHPLPWSRSVKLWLEGTPQPIRAQAYPSPSGAVIEAELGFLRLNSPVLLCFDEDVGESYCGSLVTVAVRAEPDQERPYLQLQVEVAQPWKTAGETWTEWPPLVSSLTPAADAAEQVATDDRPASTGSGQPALPHPDLAGSEPAAGGLVPCGARTPTLELPLQPCAATPEPSEPPELIIEPATPHRHEPVLDLTLRSTSCSGAFCPPPGSPEPEMPKLPSVELDDQPAETGLLLLPEEPTYSLGTEPQASSQWDLQPLDLPADSQWDLVTELPAGKRPRRSRLQFWLWAAALLMIGTTVASMVHTNLWSRAQDKLERWLPELAARVNPGRRPTQLPNTLEQPGPPLVPLAATSETQQPATPEAAMTATAAQPSQTAATPTASSSSLPSQEVTASGKPNRPGGSERTDQESAPYVRQDPQGAQLIIPLQGSIAGASHYTLADPLGLAINLPRASAKVDFGSYPLRQNGFRLLWVRPRDGGTHLRVFFKGEPQTPTLTLNAQEVVVTLPAVAAPDPVAAPNPESDLESSPVTPGLAAASPAPETFTSATSAP